MIFQIFLILHVFFVRLSTENFIETTYNISPYGFYYLFFVGTPKQMAYLKLDISSTSTQMTKCMYKLKDSDTSKEISKATVKINEKTIDIKIISDNICLKKEEITLENYLFSSTDNEITPDEYDSLSLSVKYSNKNFSLIEKLYEKGLISKRKFSMIPVNSDFGQLYFGGGFPKILIKQNNKAECLVDSNLDSWNCQLSYLFFGNNSLVAAPECHVVFSTTENDILIPRPLFEVFESNYLKPLISRGICIERNKPYKYICQCTEMESAFIGLLFDERKEGILLTKNDLFGGSIKDWCVMYIRESMNENLVIGRHFIKNHPMTYDIDRKKIKIYSNESIEKYIKTKKNNKKYQQRIYIFVCVITLLMFFVVREVWVCLRKSTKLYYIELDLI